jgi:hypothetical protein
VTSYNSTTSVYSSLLGDDDVILDATIEEMSQAVFSASPLGAYIIRPTKPNLVSAVEISSSSVGGGR